MVVSLEVRNLELDVLSAVVLPDFPSGIVAFLGTMP
jgi:hypothetical protein